jgi:hypothetical protein
MALLLASTPSSLKLKSATLAESLIFREDSVIALSASVAFGLIVAAGLLVHKFHLRTWFSTLPKCELEILGVEHYLRITSHSR